MSILVPVVSTGITLNEVPDKIAFFIELGECTQRCKGCHSPHLWEHVENKTPLEALALMADKAVEQGADAIVLMGGTTNGLAKETLVEIINELDLIAPVCLFSGSDDVELNTYVATHSNLKWIKMGSYQEQYGGLTNENTNQRFYEKGEGYTWRVAMSGAVIGHTKAVSLEDVTYKFQHGTYDGKSHK